MAQSLAERFRANREAFELGLQLGCTPAEAAAELKRRAAVDRCRDAERRLQAKINAPSMAVWRCAPDDPSPFWWQRED